MPRIESGVPGFDEVTGGGFLKSGVYILQGSPGAGKTILANQICHAHAAAGGRVVYVTLLAESHARLLQHMQSFSFFAIESLADRVHYISAFDALKTQGLAGVVNLLRGEMRAHNAGILVLDGLVMAAGAASSDEELKLFVSDLQAHSTLTGCTTLLLTSDDADRPVSAEQTMVDGILLLREHAFGPRRERNIEVVKFRGSATLRGNHAFRIGDHGIVVYPRLEAARRLHFDDMVQQDGVSSGIAGLDRMFDIGGYARGSVTAVCGPSGSGKTSLALHFATQASAQEKALFFTFYESPEFLARIARIQGLDVSRVFDTGALEVMWQPFGENLLDALAYDLLRRVAVTGAKRLVIDSVGGFVAAPAFGDRGDPFLAALTNELRRLGVTTLVTVEEPSPGHRLPTDIATMSALADTVINLDCVRVQQVQRNVWIGKSRVSRCDPAMRRITLGDAGLEVRDGIARGGDAA
ncbi:RAD55 family ATPase [Ramlibacter sp. MMS24-I3-19]|uniref:RAD55 family ATPase n=1 Tax=Ramlibacter sp. MMS24-I3-19 TaxID=3416606 RepID=UPI003D053356